MEDLARLARTRARRSAAGALQALPVVYEGVDRHTERHRPDDLRRAAPGHRASVSSMLARERSRRISDGIALLASDAHARLAFSAMNEAVARANRQRSAGRGGDPAGAEGPEVAAVPARLHPAEPCRPARSAARRPRDRRPPVLPDRRRQDRGLSRPRGLDDRASAPHEPRQLGAGVAVLMRYTLRLLTLDQLGRAAGVICALELMRGRHAWREGERKMLGDWPIEIGLWVGRRRRRTVGRKGRQRTRDCGRTRPPLQAGRPRRPGPIKILPVVRRRSSPATASARAERHRPAEHGDRLRELASAHSAGPRAAGLDGRRADLPPPAGLSDRHRGQVCRPAVGGEVGAFFDHVDRTTTTASMAPRAGRWGRKLFAGAASCRRTLIIQDELHLISGPLGTVAALYEVALDRLSSRQQLAELSDENHREHGDRSSGRRPD